MLTAYTLANIKKMSFSLGNITVSKTVGSPDTYTLSGIRYLNFADLTTSIAGTDKKDFTMLLYSNPVVDVLNMRPSIAGSQTYVIDILSFTGKAVSHEKINGHTKVL